ncbi:hypothetical protein F5Y15DRAFT_386341 [Xylariaceae sp. FL0016]|nr:hypothetical protein F5Y15DRAFT_386341 [Xylariaceae sp. FL0016]
MSPKILDTPHLDQQLAALRLESCFGLQSRRLLVNAAKYTSCIPKIAELASRYERAHSGFRNLCALSSVTIENAKKYQTYGPVGSSKYNAFVRTEMEVRLCAAIETAQMKLDANDFALVTLAQEWKTGTLNVRNTTYSRGVWQLLSDVREMTKKLAIARGSQNEILGIMTDHELYPGDASAEGWKDWDDLLHMRLPEGSHSCLAHPEFTPFQVCVFRREVEEYYNTARRSYVGPSFNRQERFCAISGRWYLPYETGVAHLIRPDVGEKAANQLFGPRSYWAGHLMSPQNGIPMHEDYVHLFEEGKIIIVPAEDEGALKVHVLDRGLLEDDRHGRPDGNSQLHNRILKFPKETRHRPSMRYLYYSACVNIFRKQRREKKGWWKDHFDERWKLALKDERIRTSTLETVAVNMGHIPESEFATFTRGLADLPSQSAPEGDMLVGNATMWSYLRLYTGSSSQSAPSFQPPKDVWINGRC